MIQARSLCFHYGSRQILRNIDLHIPAGEIWGVLGPNGSGKSTLLKLLAGILKPTSGSILWRQQSLSAMAPRQLAKQVAYVPQETFISFPFTALEITLMGRAPHLGAWQLESTQDHAIARQALQLTGAASLAERNIQTLSGGEKQRVLLARALAQQTPALLLDEPTAFLDIRHQIEVCRLLVQLRQEKKSTILCSFHDVNLAAIFCDRLLLLSEGSIYRCGNPSDVITYANICEVFGIDVYVGINDLTGLPYYMPMQQSASKSKAQQETQSDPCGSFQTMDTSF